MHGGFLLIIGGLKGLLEDIEEIANRPACSGEFKSAWSAKRLLIIGDFNYHLPLENKVLPELGLIDIWREVRGSPARSYDVVSPGITWEGGNAWWLPFDNRRMRLDRAVVLRGMRDYVPSKIEVTFNKRIPRESVLWGLWSLYPSDHYGLLVQLDRCSSDETSRGFQGREFRLTREEALFPMNPGGRTIKQIIQMRVGFVLVVVVLIVAFVKMLL
eukprot:TRINITY_DN19912_c0_g1_i1.p1 TRINITY_DN19912_c0_g1~~TRINITY_DN19912_c0_g1_i1.p1  ORF type:complete len:215 (+),score=54.12 TRINITY_DN19912_c0_g1_i1:299-943(+)